MRASAQKYPEVIAQYSRAKTGEFEGRNYHDMFQAMLDFAGGLKSLGVVRGEKIGLISNNRKEWEVADMGLLIIGAIDCPRGCDASEDDISYILSFAEVQMCIVENPAQLKKILNVIDKIPSLKSIISFDLIDAADTKKCKEAGLSFYQFDTVVSEGHEWRKNNPEVVEEELGKGQENDLATIIFTSGTTGTPKGVMLSHGNIIAQLDEVCERIFLNPGEIGLCVLPVWHAFQRAVEYVIFSQGAAIAYSKPVGSVLLADLKKMNPTLLPAVPRVFEAVYDGVWQKMRKTGGLTYSLFRFFVAESLLWCSIDRRLRRKEARFGRDYLGLYWPLLVLPWLLLYPLRLLGKVLVFRKLKEIVGKNFRAGIAGGGAYQSRIDKFFWAVGINIVEGYGLTETSPIVAVRPVVDPILRTVGTAVRGVQARVVDDEGNVLGTCKEFDKRSIAGKRRKQARGKATDVLIDLLNSALHAGHSAKYVLFDTWFSSPKTICRIKKECRLDTIAMVKKSSKIKYLWNGQKLDIKEIYSRNKKRRGRSKYLLSVMVDVISKKDDGKEDVIPAKIVYVRNTKKKKDWVALICTNTELSENEIVRIYGKRWQTEVFYKTCKSWLKLGKECRSLSYDAMTAHVAIVFARYMLLSIEQRKDTDERSICELFYVLCDELADITYSESLHLIVNAMLESLRELFHFTDEQLEAFTADFVVRLPKYLQTALGYASEAA